MENSISSRLVHAWNAFFNRDPTYRPDYGGYSYQPFRTRLRNGNEKSIVSSVFTRIAIDCSQIDVRHVKLDENGRYLSDINSGLNNLMLAYK